MQGKTMAVAGGVVCALAAAGWVGAGAWSGQQLEAELQALQARPAGAGTAVRVSGLKHQRGLLSSSGELEVRLEPELPGDLLPQRLTLQVGDRTVGTGDGDGVGGGSGPVALTLPAGQEPLWIVLTHSGGSRLALPPLHFCATLGQGEPDPAA